MINKNSSENLIIIISKNSQVNFKENFLGSDFTLPKDFNPFIIRYIKEYIDLATIKTVCAEIKELINEFDTKLS
jgi:hypothetical protein